MGCPVLAESLQLGTHGPHLWLTEIPTVSAKICQTSCSFEGAKVWVTPQQAGLVPSAGLAGLFCTEQDTSQWFSLAVAARWEHAEPLRSILSVCWGLSPQVIKEASSPATAGMEAPTSPVMPCKLDLDKVMVSNHLTEVLHGAAVAKTGECGAGNTELLVLGEESSSSQQLCGAYGALCHWGWGVGLP